MKTTLLLLQLTVFSFVLKAQLNTRLIASRYGSGIVKIICADTSLPDGENKTGTFLSRGSGFFVTDDGYIFTNRHVIETCVWGYINYDYTDSYGQIREGLNTYSDDIVYDKSFVKAYRTGYTIPVIQVFYGKEENDYKLYIAEVVAVGTGAFDGAVLKIVSDINGHKGNFRFTALPLGNSDSVQQGEHFCVFGFPAQTLDFKGVKLLQDMSTLSTGIMSGYDFNMNKDYGYIKTDAAIHGGNSGGPVFNESNKVIGIATATGNVTGIGLVGGINGMYYISASNASIHKRLAEEGLKAPERAMSINTVPGDRRPVRTVAEINNTPSNGTQNYASARVYFSNVPPADSDTPIDPAQQYSSFTIDRKKGGLIYVYIDNYLSPIHSDRIAVLIDKLNKSGKYEKFKDASYEIGGDRAWVYFPFTINEKGTFRFSAYAKGPTLISYGTVEITYK